MTTAQTMNVPQSLAGVQSPTVPREVLGIRMDIPATRNGSKHAQVPLVNLSGGTTVSTT